MPARLLGVRPDRRERLEELLFPRLLGEEDLDQPLELDNRPVSRLAEPLSERLAPMVRDGIDGSRPPAGVLAVGGRQAVGVQLLRLLVDVALGAGPVVVDAPPHLLRELVRRPAPEREEPEHEVRGGRQPRHLTDTPKWRITSSKSEYRARGGRRDGEAVHARP